MFPSEHSIDEEAEDANVTETTKRSSRNAMNTMETDLSAQLMVMPLDKTEDEENESGVAGGGFLKSMLKAKKTRAKI